MGISVVGIRILSGKPFCGLLALVMTFAAYQAVERTLVTLAWLPELWTAAGLAFAGILGMLAAGRAVRRELRRLDVY